jgi:hypothetical protein
MALSVTIETVPLDEIRDLGWPTDRHLVWSFRKTLQRGAHFSPIQLNRIWQEDTTWHYEIIDGFHRYEAAKAEGLTTLLCQVVEMEDREARYARIHACVSKPPEVTRERALRELRLAFVQDLREAIGNPEILFEPILGEDGQVHPRPRTAPLPEEPLHALEALADHLMATTAAAPPELVQRGKGVVNRTPFGRRTGWEQLLNDWLADLGERFGETATWLLGVLRMQVLIDQGFGHGWTQRQREAFQRSGGCGLHAILFWDIPDVELRAWFRRYIHAHPSSGDWLWRAIILLGFQEGPQAGKPLHSYPKSVILSLLKRYPSPKDLYRFLQAHPRGFSLEPEPLPPSVSDESPPALGSPARYASEASQAPHQESAIFAVGSSHFVSKTPQPAEPYMTISPLHAEQPDPTEAYQPVHVAFLIWVREIERLTANYGYGWLHWEKAQQDLAQLRSLLRGQAGDAAP